MRGIKKSILGIIISCMTLLLSFILVISFTFAWFVSSSKASSNGITIQSGSLDVSYKVYHYDLTSSSWQEITYDENKKCYPIDLGIIYPSKYDFFRVELTNTGSLPIKINTSINSYTSYSSDNKISDFVYFATSIVESVNTNMDTYKKSSSLTFNSFTLNGADNKDALKAGLDSSLATNKTINFVFSVYIDEDCPNDCMSKGFNISGINFVLSV